jgi:hypothetical protein
MSDQWPVILTATLGVAGTVVVAWMGIHGTRQQATDQARIEHGQWLRQQRLEAYTNLFTAWDQAINDLHAFQDSWDDTVEDFNEHGPSSGGPLGDSVYFDDFVDLSTADIWARLEPCVERAELLGPAPVQTAAVGLREAYRGLRARLLEQAHSESQQIVGAVWKEELGKAAVARSEFHTAASKVLRTSPNPQGEQVL